MKKIINGRTFNTETATHVCDLPCTANRGDFHWHETALYRSPRGQFFVAGTGNASSMWAMPAYGGGMTGGSGILLVNENEARQHMERAGCDESDFLAHGFDIQEG